ncbi:MAG: FixH family protein [Proteobacteria bacterium]|nr:FixH family protein [Pseudomonadota bacterium]
MPELASSPAAARPWYREPMLWLVMAIPALTVIGGLTTVVLAHRHSDDVVADDYRKEGLAVNRDPARDRAAAELGVTASVSLHGGLLAVHLERGRAADPGQLVVVLSHATRAEHDRLVPLRATAPGDYAGVVPPLARGHWYLEVSPPDRRWRLAGEFTDAPAALELRPGPVP